MEPMILPALIDYITNNNALYWRLERYRNKKDLDIVATQKDTEVTLEQSIAALQQQINYFPPNTRFRLTIKERPTSNGDGVMAVDFVNSNSLGQSNYYGLIGNPPIATNYGLQGIPSMQMGIGCADGARIQNKLDALEQKREELTDLKAELRIEKNNLERDRKEFEEKKKEAVAEINKLHQKYSSNTDAAKNGLSLLLGEIIGALNKNSEGKGLLGLLSGTSEVENASPKSEQETIIEDLATFIFEKNIPADELKTICGNLKTLITEKYN